MTPRQRRRLGVLGFLAGFALLLPVAGGPATADPIDDKKAEATRIQRQLEEDGTRLSINAERYNRAQIKVDEVQAQAAKAEEDVARADQRMQVVRGRLAEAAIVAYVHGGSTSLISHLARSENDDFVVRRQYLRVTAADQKRIIGEVKVAQEDLAEMRGRLTDERRAADAAVREAADAKRAASDAEAAQRSLLGRVNGDLATLVAAEDVRRQAEQATAQAQTQPRAAAQSPAEPGAAAPSGDGPVPRLSSPASAPPPVAGGAAAAVAEAEAQIGKPYLYGGSGPDSFDCSGLTAWAWNAGGVSLSHSAYSQYFETTRVAVDDVQPGDLLFFGGSVEGIHHVAIYAGGGQMVEASQTGTPIRYRGWRSGDLVGVGRPG